MALRRMLKVSSTNLHHIFRGLARDERAFVSILSMNISAENPEVAAPIARPSTCEHSFMLNTNTGNLELVTNAFCDDF